MLPLHGLWYMHYVSAASLSPLETANESVVGPLHSLFGIGAHNFPSFSVSPLLTKLCFEEEVVFLIFQM
jgi:hypothetical protein